MAEKHDADAMTRLAICAVAATAAVYGGEKLCQGQNWPLWDKVGPWVAGNKLQAIAILAAALYALSLAVWPQKEGEKGSDNDGFTPCT